MGLRDSRGMHLWSLASPLCARKLDGLTRKPSIVYPVFGANENTERYRGNNLEEPMFGSDHMLIRTPLSLHVLIASTTCSSKISRMGRRGLADWGLQTRWEAESGSNYVGRQWKASNCKLLTTTFEKALFHRIKRKELPPRHRGRIRDRKQKHRAFARSKDRLGYRVCLRCMAERTMP